MNDTEFTFSLPEGWEELRTINGRAARKSGRANTVLQMSFNRNPVVRPFVRPLPKLDMVTQLVEGHKGRITNTSEGEFGIGTYARVIFTGDRLAHGEAWILTDESHVFMATYTSEQAPDRQELQDIANIITSVRWPR